MKLTKYISKSKFTPSKVLTSHFENSFPQHCYSRAKEV
eukprot:UN22171